MKKDTNRAISNFKGTVAWYFWTPVFSWNIPYTGPAPDSPRWIVSIVTFQELYVLQNLIVLTYVIHRKWELSVHNTVGSVLYVGKSKIKLQKCVQNIPKTSSLQNPTIDDL